MATGGSFRHIIFGVVQEFVPTVLQPAMRHDLELGLLMRSTVGSRVKRRGELLKAAILAVAVLSCALAGAAAAQGLGASLPMDPWVTISYADLVDSAQLVRTGERLQEAIRRPDRKAAVQPFVDPFSALLPAAVQMLFGTDLTPQASIVERYPPGGRQPAWVSILRGGRIHLTSDGRGRARLFLPGNNPRAGYQAHYATVRIPLAMLLPLGGAPLEIEVFAYRNEYRTAELRLHTRPYRFRAYGFPPAGMALDLQGLEAFLRQGGLLEGAELNNEEGLVLYANREALATLGGERVSLSDLAVAYRAVFHAGDNDAFVSLDPNTDPLLSTVNFGGFLEDTRIGAVVLRADKRFKTFCNGLDPESFADIRSEIRTSVPSFLTNSERLFLSKKWGGAKGSWVSTRYWFFPGSCGVESSPDEQMAAVTTPWFTADAERTGEDYLSTTSKARLAPLSPEIRANIRDLNQRFSHYAAIFPEFQELSAVARLMAIMAWLRKASPGWLYLDGLLEIEVPALSTPRTIPKLLSAEFAELPTAAIPATDMVTGRSRVFHLNPELERPVAEVFKGPEDMAQFLALRAGRKAEDGISYAAEAARRFAAERAIPARALIDTEADLKAFLKIAGGNIGMNRLMTHYRTMIAQMGSLRESRSQDGETAPSKAETALATQTQQLLSQIHAEGGQRSFPTQFVQHTGGISMSPQLFTVRAATTSPALERIRNARRSDGAPSTYGALVRSSTARAVKEIPPAAMVRKGGSVMREQAAPASRGKKPATVRPLVNLPAEEETDISPRTAPALRTIQISAMGRSVQGQLRTDGRIVFTRREEARP